MKLYATVTSERGKAATKGAQEFLIIALEAAGSLVAQIELHYNHDRSAHKTDLDEWVLQYRRVGGEWRILDQENV